MKGPESFTETARRWLVEAEHADLTQSNVRHLAAEFARIHREALTRAAEIARAQRPSKGGLFGQPSLPNGRGQEGYETARIEIAAAIEAERDASQ